MSAPTLGMFFEWQGESLPEPALAKISNARSLDDGRKKLAKRPPDRVWPPVSRAIGRALGDALQVDLGEVLVGGWNAYRSLREYADPAKHPPQDLAQVALGHHVISSTHKPRVEVRLGPTTLATVEFEVELELNVESAILTLQAGRIKEVAVGKCVGKGTLSCEGAVLVEKETREVALPGRLSLGDGIPIA